MLTLIYCQNQAHGTDEILKRITEDVAQERPNRILMVPELISHDVERRLCAVAGDTASRFAQVLTFSRLASRVAEMAGSGAEQCMDNGGRIVAMASAARSLHSRLKAYASVETKPEFLASLIEAVDEFKRCCVSSEDLGAAADSIAQENSLFAQKLSELSLLLETYDALCQRGKRDPRDLMTWVLHQLRDSDFAESHEFYIDGFPDFSRQHMEVLEYLISNSEHVTVCLNCDKEGSQAMAYEKAGATAWDLLQFAKSNGIQYKTVVLEEAASKLSAVRGKLFQGQITPNPQNAEVVRLFRANSVYQECQIAAQTVRQLVQKNYRYRDIAVVCTDLASYSAPLRLVFRRCDIPLYLAGTESVLQSGVITTVISALDAVIEGMEQRSVLRYLRSSLSPLTLEECDLVENYAIIWGISGKRWQESWTSHPEGLSGQWNDKSRELLRRLNDLREQAVMPMLRLLQGLQNAKFLRDQVEVLYDFLEDTKFASRLNDLAAEMEQDNDFRGAQICNQLWEVLLGALEQLYDVLGDTDWDVENFSRLLRLMLSQYDVGTIPPVLDAVTAGDVGAMRCQREKHLIILGANEGQFPGYAGYSGLLSDQERKVLRDHNVFLFGGNMENLQTEFAEIHGVFCGAEESITLTCSEEPSFVYRRLCQMTGGTEIMAEDYLVGIENAADAAAVLVVSEDQDTAEQLGLEELYEKILHSKDYSLGSIQKENVSKLYGKQLKLSASQVDRQAECRLSYFLQYGLRAKERKEATVDPAEFGTYVHSILEQTAREVMELGGFHAVDLETTLAIADRYSKSYAAERFSELDSQRMEYLFQRNVKELKLVVQELWRELSNASYAPQRFELHFADDGEMPAIDISGRQIDAQLRGFVDRVDLWQHAGANYVRVVDYKTGKKDFDYCDVFNGVGLQMLLYLFALEEQGREVTGDTPIPAGVQYFPARVPYVSAASSHDESWMKERQKQLVRKGLLLHDEESLAAMDPSEKLDYLNCKRSKDGGLVGDLADRYQMIQLKRYVMAFLCRMVDDIASGNVQPNPYTRGTSHDACTFCPYGAVCHKQSVEGRRNYKAMSQERFWEEIGKEVDNDG